MNCEMESACDYLSDDNMSGLDSTVTPSIDDIPATQVSANGEDCELARVYMLWQNSHHTFLHKILQIISKTVSPFKGPPQDFLSQPGEQDFDWVPLQHAMAGIKTAWDVVADEISADVLGVTWLAKKLTIILELG